DVATDALRLLRLVEQAISLRLRNRPGNCRCADWLELEHGALLFSGAEEPEELDERIVHPIDDPLLEGDDGIVSDVDVFRTDAGTAFGDVAEPDPLRFLQLRDAVLDVERVHLQ